MMRSDIPFDADDAHAFLPWVIGIMVCLATLLLCLQLTVGGWIIDRHALYADSFTVNVPAGDDMAARLDKIRDMLQHTPHVTGVSQVSDSTLRNLLKPWLGNSDAVSALPLPAVLDVATDGAPDIDYKTIDDHLSAIAPSTEIDAHEQWIANFARFSDAVQWLVGSLAGLIIGGLALIIAFTSRAALKLHARTVQLLHSIGAEDNYIMRQFQREAFLLTLRGTVPGCLIAGSLYWAVGFYIATLGNSMLPALDITIPHLLLILLMPLACGGVAWAAARVSVIRQLQRVL